MKKAIITLLIIWGMMSGLHAGTTGKLAGIVTDKNNGEPLVGVNIVIKGTTMGAASGMDGQYFIVNIPVGVYVVDATMIGYKKQSIANVVIAADLTTKIDFKLIEEPIAAGEEVVVVAERPLIQKDLTASIDITDAGQVRTLPVTNYKQVVDLQTGIVVVPIRLDMAGPYGQFDSTPDDGIHSRGGRTNETAYLLNGIAVKDPLWGAFFIDDLPILGLNQLVTYKGTYLAEYGEGMSAVMNMVSEPNLKQPTFNYTTFTDRLDFVNLEKMNTYNHELVYQGTIPQTKDKLTSNLAVKYNTTDGRFWGYIYPNYRDSEGYDKSGTPKKVPMNYDDYWSTMGSLRFFPSKNLSLLVGGVATDRRTSFYNHYFKYNPYGNPRVRRNYWLGYLQSKHVLSNKYFYELSLSRYELNFKSNIFDDLKTSLIEKHIESPERFSVSGIDYVWFKTKSLVDEFKFYIFGQVTEVHQLKAGMGLQMYDLSYARRNPTAQDLADTTRMKAWEAYQRQPQAFNAYIQDKIELHKIGLILNIGLRYDRIYPKTYRMRDVLRPTSTAMDKTPPVDSFSPRLGVSYPIADKMAFRFAYGIYYQYPSYYLVYQGVNEEEKIYPNYSLGEVTQIGDGGVRPEKTTSYETGVQVAVGPQMSMNITAFYRDMADLIGLRTIYGPRTYQLFTNDAYGIARGIELDLHSKFSDSFWLSLNYTFSNVHASKRSIWYVPLYPQNRMFIADWDLPHKLTFQMDYVLPSQLGIALIGELKSGYPYSPNALNPNSERGPAQKDLNVNLYKKFKLFGFHQTVFVHITNIFNQRNVYWVYPDTGKPGVDTNEGTSPDYTNNPTAWGPRRHIRVGLTINN